MGNVVRFERTTREELRGNLRRSLDLLDVSAEIATAAAALTASAATLAFCHTAGINPISAAIVDAIEAADAVKTAIAELHRRDE